MRRIIFITSLLVKLTMLSAQTVCTITIDPSQINNPAAKKLLGINFNGQSSMDYNSNPSITDTMRYYDPVTGTILPAVPPLWDRVHLGESAIRAICR